MSNFGDVKCPICKSDKYFAYSRRLEKYSLVYDKGEACFYDLEDIEEIDPPTYKCDECGCTKPPASQTMQLQMLKAGEQFRTVGNADILYKAIDYSCSQQMRMVEVVSSPGAAMDGWLIYLRAETMVRRQQW